MISCYCFSKRLLTFFFFMCLPDEKQAELTAKYPFDDLLVKPEDNNPALSNRPPTIYRFQSAYRICGKFSYAPGFLFIIWENFMLVTIFPHRRECNLLQRKQPCSPCGNACHTFHLLIKDEGAYFAFLQNKRREKKWYIFLYAFVCEGVFFFLSS